MAQPYLLPTLYRQSREGFMVIAHRGAGAYYPENTMPAFEAAMQMGADMIELDVQLSSDGVPVVVHDVMLDDHTDGQGPLSYYSFDELKELDAGSWKGREFGGTKIPSLEKVLACASGKIALNIEIKTEAVAKGHAGGVEQKCLELVKKHDMEKYVLFSSFDYRAVVHLKKLNPKISVALLYNRRRSDGKLPSQLVRNYRADAFNFSYGEATKTRLTDLKKHHIPHFVYTVNTPRRMRKLLAAGVSGIFTDKPDLLKTIVENNY